MKPLAVMVKVEPGQQQQSPSTPSTPTNSSSTNNTTNNSHIASSGHHHHVGNNHNHQHNNLIMMNPSSSIYPSCLPLAMKSNSSSFIPSQTPPPPHQQGFSLPSIHNLTSQQPSSKVMVDHIHHYQQQHPQSWRGNNMEPKPPLHSNGGHDLMEALSAQPQTIVRYAPPLYQAIIQPSIDIVPMDSFIPGYISGYRKTPQQVTIGTSPEMQPSSNPSSSTTTGIIVTNSPTMTPVKVSHCIADQELVKTTQSVIVASSSAQQAPSSNNTQTQQPPTDPSQARMACINCRKSHRKCKIYRPHFKDKGMPCGECKKRGIPDECVYYEPKKRGPKMKTAEEEAQSKEEAKKRKVSKKNEVPSATVVDLERTNLLQSNSQIIASSSSNAATTTPVIPALFSRKEIDRRNYILHMIFPEANLPNDIKENCPDDSFNEMFRLFLSDEFVSFLVECMDGNKSKNQLMPFIREKVLLSILNRIMEPYYHGMYFSLESLFLKYYCLFKLSPHDDNRPILLLESEKSVKQNKKDFNIITNDIQTIICNLWSSFFNTILEFKSVNSSYNQLVIKNMLDLIVNKLSENVDIQSCTVQEIGVQLSQAYLPLWNHYEISKTCRSI
ncbi:predicted protein [Naegleria gruberi]|uniref:Predicted protein n=1 Tax=Naegleria gruberi TaxID=5762 RepID=D2W4X5_NAEGR|nr:uncharacterized protein NAEGRDRAFT_82335 [Naegleria gruberi]EFC35878.1 predicted protein [Naegleria gruberi]|eukprot:XP_002668622.1 predicted protein [Naegleria gruberi strain NEG-M]